VSARARPSGRHPLYVPRKEEICKVHLSLGVDLGKALTDYCNALGEQNISLAVRTLLRERLSQLGYVKEKIELFSLAKRVQENL